MLRRRLSPSRRHHHYHHHGDVVCIATPKRVTTPLLIILIQIMLISAMFKVATAFRCISTPVVVRTGRGQRSTSSFIAPMVLLQQHRATSPCSRTSSSSSSSTTSSSTSLSMFMGSDGGLLGIGTPEVVRRFSYTLHPKKEAYGE
jgi:hypothetical protein